MVKMIRKIQDGEFTTQYVDGYGSATFEYQHLPEEGVLMIECEYPFHVDAEGVRKLADDFTALADAMESVQQEQEQSDAQD